MQGDSEERSAYADLDAHGPRQGGRQDRSTRCGGRRLHHKALLYSGARRALEISRPALRHHGARLANADLHRRNRTRSRAPPGAQIGRSSSFDAQRVRLTALPDEPSRDTDRPFEDSAGRLGRGVRPGTRILAHIHASVAEEARNRSIRSGILADRTSLRLPLPGTVLSTAAGRRRLIDGFYAGESHFRFLPYAVLMRHALF